MSLPERPDYDDRDSGYGLVMPFRCVTSVGGPFDDDAFTAGFQAGQLWQRLSTPNLAAASEMVYEALEEQVDLIAMARGLKMDVLWRGDGWVHLGFVRPSTGIMESKSDDPCRAGWHDARRVKRADRCPLCGEANR